MRFHKKSLVPGFNPSLLSSAYLCPRAWIYERVPGYELAGYDDRVLSQVATRAECQDICLEDVDLPCRSAEYDYKKKECRLSKETRRTQPAAYRLVLQSATKRICIEIRMLEYGYWLGC